MSKDYYKVLGVSKTATAAEIKTAFKKLARQYHPDMNPDNKKVSEDKFKEVSEAYEVLGDDKKRKQYDQYGSFDFGGRGPHNPYSQQYWQNVNVSDIDLEDIFGDVFGFGGPKRGRKTGGVKFDFGQGFANHGRDGTDINWALDIDFLEAVNGCEKNILLGDGQKVRVKIPQGVDEGSKIRLAGKGNPGVGGGRAGDLIIEIHVRPDPHFKRVGDDIHLDFGISLGEVLRGVQKIIPTIDGEVQVKIPKGSQSGQVLRLKDKGVKNLKTKIQGHQFVRLLVKYPRDLTEDEIKQIAKILDKHS